MKFPIVSIITPCYNAAQYMGKCLDSLRNQDLQEWEAIVINDGSKDNTASIGKRYAEIDSRIKFLTQRNEGVSIARNRALEIAQGKYVFFLDADDYILANDALQTLVAEMESQSLEYIRFEYAAVDKNDQILFENKNKYLSLKWHKKTITPGEYLKKVALPRDEFYLCMCMFCTSIIKEHNLSFIPNCRYREDADFILRYLGYCDRAMYLTTPYYAYRKHEGAATVSNRDYSNDLRMLISSLSEFQKTCNNTTYSRLIDTFKKELITKPSVANKIKVIFKKMKRYLLFMLYR